MAYGELYLPPQLKPYNAKTGCFLKGHVPHNKGKKWSEYMSKRGQRRAAKGWKNLTKFRPATRPDTAGRCRKAVIALEDDGSWHYFPYLRPAAEWCGGSRENVGRCCRENESRRVNRKTGRMNTDHCYKGIRFYFEADGIWTTKINKT